MLKNFLRICALVVVSLVIITAPASAAKPSGGGGGKPSGGPKDLIGYDVSWPQCGKKLPGDAAFVIVGVNDGLANTTNRCLEELLRWGMTAKGGTNQPKLQLYVNTANPGGLNTTSWPQNNIDPAGNVAPNPHLTCDGSDSIACAWQYGWNRAVEDDLYRFKPIADKIGISSLVSDYVWWLDVETENTWKEGGTDFDYQSNVADLEGMAAYFRSVNAQVGLYSTEYQWNYIVGDAVSETSNLNGLPNWRPSGSSLANAKANCSLMPLTKDGYMSLTQYISRNLDHNYSCI